MPARIGAARSVADQLTELRLQRDWRPIPLAEPVPVEALPTPALLVDVGQIFNEDVERAAARLPALEAAGAVWLEEPFQAGAYAAYGALAARCETVRLAGGEGAHNTHMARHLIDYAGVGFIQIDCGRIGGIGPAKCAIG